MLNIHNAQNNQDLPEQIRQFDLLSNSLFKLIQSLCDKEIKLPHYQTELENKFFRYGLANQSIINLAKGNKFQILDKDVDIRDIFSLFSLTRMQIEAFTVMYYLFFDNEDLEVKNFRYDIYRLHGLQKQSKFTVDSEYAKIKIAKILSEINEIQDAIKISSLYKSATLKKQKYFLEPEKAKLISTYDIIVLSGLKSQKIDDMWNLYSNHTHGEYISDRQFNTIYRIKKSANEDTSTIITLNSILTAKLCTLLIDTFDCAKDYYNQLNLESIVLIDTWKSIH